MAKGTSKVYTAVFERDDDGMWVASVKGLAGCHTQGRTIAAAQKRIREALALFVGDKAAEAAELHDEFVLPKALDRAVVQFHRAREQSDERAKWMGARLAQAVLRLEEAGISRRDAASLVHLSHQRVQQVLDDARAHPPAEASQPRARRRSA